MAIFACCREIHKLKVHCKCVEATNSAEAEKKIKSIEDKEKNKPDDIREHPVLGTTYRLKILELGDRGEKRTVSRQELAAKINQDQHV